MKHHITEKDAVSSEEWRRIGCGTDASGAPVAQPSPYLNRLAAEMRRLRYERVKAPDSIQKKMRFCPSKDQAIPLRLVSDAEMHERARRIEDALKKLERGSHT